MIEIDCANIGLNERRWYLVSIVHDSTSSIDANARQLDKVMKGGRQSTTSDGSRCLVEVSSAAVIAQPLPRAEHLGQLDRCQRLNVRKLCGKLCKLRQDASNLRLLQHQLTHQHIVQGWPVTPWHWPVQFATFLVDQLPKIISIHRFSIRESTPQRLIVL